MIYLDNNATTLLDPQVLAVMQPLLSGMVGNPSSVHHLGQQAKALITEATKTCADFFGVRTEEIIFTSGATEALNFLIRGLPRGAHAISSSLEHVATIESLKKCGSSISFLDPLAGSGSISVKQIEQALRPTTQMIVLSGANNETGIRTDFEAIAALAEENQIIFILDGVALLGKAPFTLPAGVTAACFSGHKIHAPLGVGFAIIRKSYKPECLIVGGPQQRGLRAGTENVPSIVGLAKALHLIKEKGACWSEQICRLRDLFEARLMAEIPNIVIHGKQEPRICNTSNISFPGIEGETLLMLLDLAGLAASHGSACSAGALQPSRVLLSMGMDPKIARSSLRFSLSRFTTEDEIEKSVSLILEAFSKLTIIR